MKTIALEVPDDLVGLSGRSDEALARDLRTGGGESNGAHLKGLSLQGSRCEGVSVNCTPLCGRPSLDPDPLPQGEGA